MSKRWTQKALAAAVKKHGTLTLDVETDRKDFDRPMPRFRKLTTKNSFYREKHWIDAQYEPSCFAGFWNQDKDEYQILPLKKILSKMFVYDRNCDLYIAKVKAKGKVLKP